MDDDEEDDDRPPFQWNWQAGVMVAFTAVMLIIPLGGVIYLLQGYVAAPAPTPKVVAPAANTQPLAASLEHTVNTQLGGDNVKIDVDSELTLALPADQIAARMARISELAKIAGGSALEMPADGAKERRLVIQTPSSRRDLLRRAITGEKIDFEAVPVSPDSEILNVILRTK